MSERFDSIILDVDGTLWDSTKIVASAWSEAVKKYDGTKMLITADMLKSLFGRPMTEIAEKLFTNHNEKQRLDIMDLCCEYEHEALENNQKDICYENVIDTIKELSKHKKLFIISNCQSGYIELFLRKTGLGEYITDIECFGNTGKSKGENIVDVIKRNNLKNPVYVGDTKGDCTASGFAEIPFIYAAYGFGDCDSCYMEIQKFSQLLELI